MPSFAAGVFEVNETVRSRRFHNTDGYFLVKNLGPYVVYVGETYNGPEGDVVTPATGFPISPGESVEIPDTTSTDVNLPCFNTTGGTSRVAYLAKRGSA